jgi:hypothetical protein
LGNAQQAQIGIQAGGAAATAIGIALHASWVPLVGPAVAGAAIALALIFNRRGPAQKVRSTQIVDDIEPVLKQNVAGYLAGPRTKASQAQALKTFDEAWAYVKAACGVPELGDPGRACITDRDRGGPWDWFSYYRDPIAKDAPANGTTGLLAPLSALTEAAGGAVPWMLLAAIALVILGLIL